METQEDQLQESGVQDYVNTVELYRKIKHLQTIRLKNEAALNPADLEGKYRVSYERLCESIKQAQMDYRTECTRVARTLAEILAELAYFDPTDEEYEAIRDFMCDKIKECCNDPLLTGLTATAIERLGGEDKDELGGQATQKGQDT